MESLRPSDLRPSDLRPKAVSRFSPRPSERPSDWRFFIADDAVAALYVDGAMLCRALRRVAVFFVLLFLAPRDEEAAALNVEEDNTAKDCRRFSLSGMVKIT